MSHRSERRTLAREFIKHRLAAGQVITIADIALAAGIDVPEDRSREVWLSTYFGPMIYKVAKDIGGSALSLGRGVGYKLVETEEGAALADRRSKAQLIGQVRRRKALRRFRPDENPDQLQFRLEEVPADGADALSDSAAASSK